MSFLKKSKKFKRFVIKLPNGTEMLISTNSGWASLIDVVKYFKEEHGDNIVIRPVSFLYAFKFSIGGKYVNQ